MSMLGAIVAPGPVSQPPFIPASLEPQSQSLAPIPPSQPSPPPPSQD